MLCLLCLCVERDEQLIDIASAESSRHNVASIIHAHFSFFFQEEPTEGHVCQKCWVKVSVFHEFYTQIECVHRSNDSIFVESIVDDIKPSVDSDSDKWDLEPPELAVFDEKPRIVLKRTKGRPRKNKTISSEDSDDDFFDDSNLAEATENKDEVHQEPNVESERKQKKGRSRKDDPLATKREEIFICDKCAVEFTTHRGLHRHTKLVHDVLEFPCGYMKCIESYATQEERDIHFDTAHKQTDCPHCKKKILVKCIDQHIKEQHNAGNEVICDICGRISATKVKHKSHYRKVHQVHDKLQCDICKRWLKHRDALKGHILRHLQGPQTCPTCGHVSPNRKALSKHRQTHNPQRKERFKCPTCGKGCRDKMSLLEHSHIHTGFAGNYHCGDCGRVFRFSSSFCLHKKKMHPK